MITTTIPQTPLAKIAMGLSGGGYRAASFHLGSMSYLHWLPFKGKPLLENVKIISTVSGGTITGVVYASMAQQGASFRDIYTQLHWLLRNFDLVEEAMELLKTPEKMPGHKRKNLINAFAQIYHERYTQGLTFAVFKDLSKVHFDEVVFNATDFDHGLAFRFQNKGFMGNQRFRIPDDAGDEICLGDIIATSSCFPGGFEPIGFPSDLAYAGAGHLYALRQNPLYTEDLGLMDGGIYDNQGVDSIIWSDRRHTTAAQEREGEHYYDLLLISDVSSPYMEDFKFCETPQPNEWRELSYKQIKQWFLKRYNRLRIFLLVLMILSLAGVLFLRLQNNWMTGASAAVLILSTIVMISISVIKNRLTNSVNDLGSYLLNKIPPFFREKLSVLDLDCYCIGQIEPLLLDRIYSLNTMVSDVFLKQIRRLVYRIIFTDETWRYRRLGNLIRELTPMDMKSKFRDGTLWDTRSRKAPPQCDAVLVSDKDDLDERVRDILGDKIPAVADGAVDTGTTLWFTPRDLLDEKLKKLLASGQFTMCYNLLVYLNTIRYEPDSGYDQLPQEEKDALEALHDRLRQDWQRFREDPYFLFDHYAVAGV